MLAIELDILKSFPEEQQEFIKAKFSPPIHSLRSSDFENKLLSIIEDAFKANGSSNKDTSVIEHIFEQLKKDFQRPKFKAIGIGQIELACYKGARKEYHKQGEFFAVNVTAFHSWIDSYLRSKENTEALNQFLLKTKETTYQTRSTTTIDQVMFSKQAIQDSFKRYKESGNMPLAAHAYYNILNELIGVEFNGKKTLVPDHDARKKIAKEVEENLTTSSLKAKDRAERIGNLTQAEILMGMITSEFSEASTLVNEIKKAFLKHYFDELIKKNEELVFSLTPPEIK